MSMYLKTRFQYPARGFTLVEMVVYIAGVALLFVVVINTVLTVSGAWGNSRVNRNIAIQGNAVMERILREIRLADSVNVGASVLGVHPGVLNLNTIVSSADTTPIVREFLLNASSTILRENSVDTQLTTRVEVSNLVFYHIINGGTSETVRVVMTIEDSYGKFKKSKNFYGTAVLRGSY